MNNEISEEIILQVTPMEDEGSIPSMQNTHDMNHENSDIVLANSTDLDWAQINYAINSNRLMFINSHKTWSSFYINNGNQYNEYTPEELCHRFLKRVLPNIYDYELSEDELHLLNVLELHPYFDKTERGFNTVEQSENLTFPSNEAAIANLMTQGDSFNEINFVGEHVESNNQILTREQAYFHRNFNLSSENAALLSVVLCPNEDLPNCELLTVDELHKRLKAAKSRFQNCGEQLENINIPVDVLLKKLDALIRLREAVTKIMNKSFCERNEV